MKFKDLPEGALFTFAGLASRLFMKAPELLLASSAFGRNSVVIASDAHVSGALIYVDEDGEVERAVSLTVSVVPSSPARTLTMKLAP